MKHYQFGNNYSTEPKQLTELPLAEQIKIADELVLKLRREKSSATIAKDTSIPKFGNIEVDIYSKNLDAMAEKQKGKIKRK